ncbi:MAG: recombinase RecA [bacterium]
MEEDNKERRAEALEVAIGYVERQFGKGALMRLGEKAKIGEVPAISTGALTLDLAIGVGGVPRGRVIEVFGPESSGKTTLTLEIIAHAQRQGGIAAFIDAEHAMDPTYARKVGVDIDNLLISQPDSGEEALEIADTLVRSGAIDVVVIDSVAALVPKVELDGSMEDIQVGAQARLMSKALRKLTANISKTKTCCIFINQIREKIGGMGYGPSETTTGGRALKFYSSVRLDLRRIQTLKVGEEAIGGRIKVKVAKNKVAPPFREAEFDMLYEEGISSEGCLIDLALGYKLIKQSGAWFAYEGLQLGQGREKVRQYLKENQALRDEIEQKIKEKLGLVKTAEEIEKPSG